jgi:hypothetical protein
MNLIFSRRSYQAKPVLALIAPRLLRFDFLPEPLSRPCASSSVCDNQDTRPLSRPCASSSVCDNQDTRLKHDLS